MSNQLSITENIISILNKIISAEELDPDAFAIVDSSSDNITTKTIALVEKPYPYSELNKFETKTTGFMRYNIKGYFIELYIKISDYKKLNLNFDEKIISKDNLYYHLEFDTNSNEYLDLIETLSNYAYKNYQSSNTFGCCGKYKQCSAAKHCLHENKLYATGCAYKKNLDAGRIFY